MDTKFGAKLFDTGRRFEADSKEQTPEPTETQTRSEEEVAELLTEGSTESPAPAQNLSVIGKTLVFKGELSAAEDILIQGNIQGTIKHSSTNLTVGAHGKVDADIDAQNVIVQGTVNGDIRGEKSVVIEPSARVQGNLLSPVIGVKEGAKFKGTIDMSEPSARVSGSTETTASSPKPQDKTESKTGKSKTLSNQPEKSATKESVSESSVDAILET